MSAERTTRMAGFLHSVVLALKHSVSTEVHRYISAVMILTTCSQLASSEWVQTRWRFFERLRETRRLLKILHWHNHASLRHKLHLLSFEDTDGYTISLG